MDILKKLEAQGARALVEQPVNQAGAGTIVQDVSVLLDFIGQRRLESKSRNGNLPADVLPLLNNLLPPPIELELKRPLLRDYPNVAGVYALLRVMEFVHPDGRGVGVHSDNVARWRDLNPTEQYFALLEAWLLRAQESVLGAVDRSRRRQFADNLSFLTELSQTQWRCTEKHFRLAEWGGGVRAWNVHLQARFGLIAIERAEPNARRFGQGRGWVLGRARRTAWGTGVAWALAAWLLQECGADAFFYDPPENADFGSLQPAFQPWIPAWRTVYVPEAAARTTGKYVFRAGFAPRWGSRSVWRRLAAPGRATLDDLAGAVLEAFEFSDTEHLYEFSYRDRLGRQRKYNHPYCDDGPYASELEIQDMELMEKEVVEFLFDFGSTWKFELKLERIEPVGAGGRKIELREAAGEAPPQYPEQTGW
jgi:hypothetical protein